MSKTRHKIFVLFQIGVLLKFVNTFQIWLKSDNNAYFT